MDKDCIYSIEIIDIKVNGEIIVFMVMVDCLEMNNYFFKVNFKMDLNMV